MKYSKNVGHICSVVWLDAVGLSEWRTEREACSMPLARIVSVGHVLAVTGDVFVMAADRDENGNVNGIGVIPTGWVQSVERLA